MSKRSANQARPQPAAKSKVSKPSSAAWFDRTGTATDRDEFYKKIFWASGLAILLITIVLALGSGINGDDEYQNDYSEKLVSYYSSFGSNADALRIDESANDPYNKGKMYYYGGFFDIVTGMVNKAFGLEVADAGYHNIRHIFNAIFGVLAMLFTALLAKEIAGWRAGILTLFFMFLSPRFLGHSLMNPKDIPFAAGYVIALYYMVRLFRLLPEINKSTYKAALGVALGMALAIATRAGGLILVGIFGLFAGLDFLSKNGIGGLFSEGRKVGVYAASVAGVSLAGFVAALLFWPYAMQSPIAHAMEALGEFSKLGIKIRVLFAGENVMSDKTSWDYALQWIWRTIPLFTLVGFIGSFILLPKIWKKWQPLPVLLALFAAVFPVFYIIAKDSILHDGWRHLMFVYPTMAVVAALFWLILEDMFSKNKTAQYALYAVVGLMVAESTLFIVRNPHYPYVYFNAASGGISNAFGNYETDYWGVSVKQGLEWLEDQGKISPTMTDTVVVASSFVHNVRTFIDKRYNGHVKLIYQKFNNRYERSWDYGIFPSRYIKGPQLRAGGWPNARSIHEVTANGVPLLSIEQGGGAVFQGDAAFANKDWQGAINAYNEEVKNNPKNELAWMKMAQSYINIQDFAKAQIAADNMLKTAPDNVNGLFYRGVSTFSSSEGRPAEIAKAEADFRKAIEVEEDFPTAYYYLAAILSNDQRKEYTEALDMLQKAISMAPRFKEAYALGARIYDELGDVEQASKWREVMNQM